jgi:hypothetical protein
MTETYKYILLDGALWQEDMEIARQYDAPRCSLFRGKPAEELNNVAPYLFCVSDDNDLEEWVNVKEQKHPIERRFLRLTSHLDIDGLRKHLRRFLRVKKENGKFLYYRFYDPKVIACTLPHLAEEQLQEFFCGITEVVHFSDVLHEKRTYTYADGKCVISIEPKFNA